MKKYFLIISFTILFLLAKQQVLAITTTPTPQPSEEPVSEKFTEQINNLKEKIASRVAELRLVEKRGIIGTVTDVSGTQITLLDINKQIRIIDVDELTKFSSVDEDDDEFGISDIKKGDIISIIGLYNKDSRRLLARFIETTITPIFISGTISAIDEDEFTVTVKTVENKDFIVDIEKTTKTAEYLKEDGLTKSGFSNMELGKRIYVVGYVSKTDKNRISATRITLLSDLPTNPVINVTIIPQPTDTQVTPSITPKTSR
jgi:hypothetical protein